MSEATEHHQRETLERSIPFRSYVALGLGVIVGVGRVVYSGQWLQAGGPLGAMLAFLFGRVVVVDFASCRQIHVADTYFGDA